MAKIKITLNGQGGELDHRIVEVAEGVDTFENHQVNDAVKDLADSCILSVGDTITIEEV